MARLSPTQTHLCITDPQLDHLYLINDQRTNSPPLPQSQTELLFIGRIANQMAVVLSLSGVSSHISLSYPPPPSGLFLRRRLACLKYLVLANMLMKSGINPFDSQEVSNREKPQN